MDRPVSRSRSLSGIAGALVVSLIYLLFALFVLDDFGVTWDEEVHFAAADVYLDKIVEEGVGAAFSRSDFPGSMEYYGPAFDIWGSLNYRVFHRKLGWLAAENARHLHLIIVAALTVFFTYLFVRTAHSTRAAVFSSLFLVAFPRFLGHSFNNPKDIPVTLIFLVSFYLLFLRVKTGKRIFSLGLAVAVGIGFSTKITYVVAPIVILSYIILYYIIQVISRKMPIGRLFAAWDVLLALVAGLPVGVIFWPYLWSDTLTRLLEIFRFFYYHQEQSKLSIIYWGEYYEPGRDLPWHYGPIHLLITTPLITLGSIILGLSAILISAVKRKITLPAGRVSGRFSLLLLLWVVIGLVPFVIPGQRVYDGIRHFLYIVPPLCMIAGVGLDCLVTSFRGLLGAKFSRPAVGLIFLLLFISVFSYHPFYTVYYNELIGGPRGAFNRFSLEYWGNAYKPACRWLNRNAPDGSTVLVLMAPHIARYYLRDDIIVLPPSHARLPRRAYDFSLYTIRDDDPLLARDAEAVYAITVKGQPIVRVHRWP